MTHSQQHGERSSVVAGSSTSVSLHQLDALAFEEVVGAQVVILRQRAFALTKDREAAQDLVQDTLERAYRAFATFRPGSNARAWLVCIMRRIWISGHRRHAGAPCTVPFDEHEESLPCRRDGGAPFASDVEARVVDELSVASILTAIEGLPFQIRQVVMMADMEDAPYGAIAEALAVPIGTVASRLFRGRRQLQDALAEQARGAGYLARAALS